MKTIKIRFRDEELDTLAVHNHLQDKLLSGQKIEELLQDKYNMTPEIMTHYSITELEGELIVHPTLEIIPESTTQDE